MKDPIQQHSKLKFVANGAYERLQLCRQEILWAISVVQVRWFGGACVNAKKMRFWPTPGKTICHIIGSGWSLNHSGSKATTDDAFVFGFNRSDIRPVRFDACFMDFAGLGLEELAQQQRRFLQERVLPCTQHLFFKGIATTAIFLDSPAAAFITMSCLHIDDGIGSSLHDPA